MTSPLFGQMQKTLHGTVHDPLGAIVVSASVDLLQNDRIVASTNTSSNGTFYFDVPKAERYSVRVIAVSFETTTTPAIYVGGSGEAELDVTLATHTLTQQVTVTANGTPTPEAQTGAPVNIISSENYRYMTNVQDPLRLVPSLQITQTGQMGGTTGLNIRGGGTDANKVLIDDVPANSIGGRVEFANLASVGIDSIEVLREPNSALYGSDALAGVVSLRSTRGTTPLPLLTYSGDAGNFGTYRNEITAGTVYRQFDFYSAFARIDTRNSLPNSQFHNATYAGNFGWTPNSANDLRFTVRHLAASGGQPNAIAFFGIPDDAQQKEQDSYYNAVWNNQSTPSWHNQIRYGGLRQNGQFNDFGAVGIPDGFGNTDGAPVTITGANGYGVSGQAIFYFAGTPLPSSYLETTNRDFVYAQTDFRFSPRFLALGAFKYENESGLNGYSGSTPNSIQRGNYSYTIQISGNVKNRLFYNLGTGLEDNGLFGFAATPRASLAYYLFRPSLNGFFSGTKLHGNFGKGIKEPSIFQQADSLFATLAALPNGSQLVSQYHVTPVDAENSRTFDAGLDQQLLYGRARIGITYFHNEFTNGVEYVPQEGLLELGVPAANLPAFSGSGAYLNSSAFRAQGLEFESEYRLSSRIFARCGYTYTDAVVQRSFSSDNLFPTYNTASNFSTIQIGAFSPLVGARPFRIAPHTGYFGLNYTHSRLYASLTGSFVSRRDDSDFLTDSNFGNSLLLPNRNLLGSYQRIELGGGYEITPRINVYTNVQNLLSEHYFEAFGFPALPLSFRSGIKLSFGGESWKLN
ncbi:TonB-dependent receptor [Granulicella arctica]|uniref:Iron complex outermembrane receptor protein/vitamin B12 transporter n=1 Tax=Granulicella arctica TaxID=940613 RepID=A0A7Y9PHL2_9BACT|nr:TonB-dependent receptor [Granulicella arctica]NYF80047.1 iron complex outermembrane receptor protein/vitamin B12 transporter [Granulicella arctica]